MFKSHETAFKYMIEPAFATFIGSTEIRIYADKYCGANFGTKFAYLVCYLSFNKAFEILLRSTFKLWESFRPLEFNYIPIFAY